MASTEQRRRPLLEVPKAEVIAYALLHNLQWREDSSNTDERYLRNYIRHRVVAQFSAVDRQQFVRYITRSRHSNQVLDAVLTETLASISSGTTIERSVLQKLPAEITKELVMAWWRANGFQNYQAITVTRAYQALRRGQTGAITPLKKPFFMTIGRHDLALHKYER